jgi:hypothetical protein
LRVLVARRQAAPGEAIAVLDLADAGWPSHRLDPILAASRVYNVLAELRRRGLRAAILTRDDGYLLDPALEVRAGVVAAPAPRR